MCICKAGRGALAAEQRVINLAEQAQPSPCQQVLLDRLHLLWRLCLQTQMLHQDQAASDAATQDQAASDAAPRSGSSRCCNKIRQLQMLHQDQVAPDGATRPGNCRCCSKIRKLQVLQRDQAAPDAATRSGSFRCCDKIRRLQMLHQDQAASDAAPRSGSLRCCTKIRSLHAPCLLDSQTEAVHNNSKTLGPSIAAALACDLLVPIRVQLDSMTRLTLIGVTQCLAKRPGW